MISPIARPGHSCTVNASADHLRTLCDKKRFHECQKKEIRGPHRIPKNKKSGHTSGGVGSNEGGGALAVRLITKSLKIVFCLFVGYEENQAQELAVDAARGRHARQKKSHTPICAAICVAIIADLELVGSGALENVVRVVGVAELAAQDLSRTLSRTLRQGQRTRNAHTELPAIQSAGQM